MSISINSHVRISLAAILLSSTLFSANPTNATYLALGDSVAFGLDVTLFVPNQPPPPPSAFVGYPEIVAMEDHPAGANKEINAACPGETSSSFVTAGAQDYGCHSLGPQGQPPFKTSVGLKADYPGTQLQFAVSELSSDKHINLVTLGIGSNDALLAIKNCQTDPNPNACFAAKLPGVLQTYAANLTTILTAIRKQAGYNGKLVLVGTYSPTAQLIPVAIALNMVTLQVGFQFGAIYADGFTAFQLAAIPFGGDVCKAGLLIHLDPTTCDIHPSPKGRDLLAKTVLFSIGDFF
jgi:lysophospholipase L1-like esterase